MQAVAVLVVCYFQMVTLRPLSTDNTDWQTSRAVAAILSTNPPCEHATLFLTDGKKEAGMVQAPRGVTFFQAAAENLSVPRSNASHSYLAKTVDHVRQASHFPSNLFEN
ncbi:uncharacterized protein LOC123512041 [Portunus trituberculatus]|uniref:uncharacterized protein LOC123512040 n=1 Tax=Portunus trituberculatus TaxID=210409 RepID=UPI001E1CD8F5|nr:uncharacterized protein LOC123512040 [Portunus trituberculatus]XP_045124133.1 uncharacterized protein LOC123512041 [Portunus trituberculatus]